MKGERYFLAGSKDRFSGAMLAGVACLVGLGAECASGGELTDLADRIAGIDSIGVVASVQVQVIDPVDFESCCPLAVEAGGVIEGSYSYMADGSKWRIDSYLDPAQYPGMNTSVLFDDSQFAYQDNEQSVLSIRSGVPADSIGMVLVNPTFEMIQFLLPLDASNEGHETQLADAKAAASAASLSGVQWSPVVFEGKALDRAAFPGSVYEGIAYTHRVYAKPTQHDRPLVIDRVDGSGRVITRTRLSSYQDVLAAGTDAWSWPKRVSWQVFDRIDQTLLAQISMEIDWMVIDQPGALAAGVFDAGALAPVDVVLIDGVVQP